MATMIQKRQRFIQWYREQKKVKEVDMHDIALAAKKMGWKLPVPPDPLELLAKQFSQAAGEETRTDKHTKREYKANLAITEKRKDGKQHTLWLDVDNDAPRHRMVKGLHLYREQMVGEAVIGKNTAEHWSSHHPDQQPLIFDTDMTDDVKWRENAPVEEKIGKAG